MIRKEQWPTLMWEKIEELTSVPFEWGTNDCCMFTAKVIDAICVDGTFAERLSQKYTDESSALRYIANRGGIEPAVSEFIGESKTGRPQRGDVVMFAGDNGDTLGVFVGNAIASVTKEGVVFIPRNKTICYWSI